MNLQWKERTIGMRMPIIGLLLALCLGGGCGKKYQGVMSLSDFLRVIARKKPTPPTTLMVSGESVTINDIEDLHLPVDYLGRTVILGSYLKPLAQSAQRFEQFETQARPAIRSAVNGKVGNILLYQKAKTEMGEPEKVDEALEKAMTRVWSEYRAEHGGNDAEAMRILKEEEELTKEQYLESKKREMLAEIHLESRLRRNQPISHIELLEYYEDQKDEQFAIKPKITIRLIDIKDASIKMEDPTLDRRAQAVALARDLRQQILAGEDFDQMAKTHSHGHMARLGGLWQPRDPTSLAPPYDVLARVAEEMQTGDLSEPIEVPGRVFLMRLEEKQSEGYAPLETVQTQIEMQIRLNRQQSALQELYAEIEDLAQVGNIDQFVQYAVEVLYRRYARS